MRLSSLSILTVPLLCCGCAGTFEQPDKPAALTPPNSFYLEADYTNDLKSYDDDVRNGAYTEAKDLRNKMITLIAADIDFNYGEYKGRLHTGRAGIETAGDVASLGLTAAVTVVGGTALKSILGAADTALKGSMQSYSNNFFEQKTTELLISSMDSIRTTKETEIIKNLDLPVTTYPFGEAKMDLVKLFFLGTREAGLAALEADSGKKAVDAKTDAADAAQARVDNNARSPKVTDNQVTMMRAIQNKVLAIAKNGPGMMAEGNAILKRSDPNATTLTDNDALVAALKKLQAPALKDPSKLQGIYQDFFP